MGRSESAIKERKLKKKKYSNIRHKGLKKRLEESEQQNQVIKESLRCAQSQLVSLKRWTCKGTVLTSVSKRRVKDKRGSIIATTNKLTGDVVELTEEVIGEGAFGLVKVGRMTSLGINCAVKIGKSLDHFDVSHEAAALQRLQGSKNFPHLFGVFEGKLVMEYVTACDGENPMTIYAAKKNNFLGQEHWTKICYSLIKALTFIHKNGLLLITI